VRVIRDNTGIPKTDLWFEVAPDKFMCASSVEEAEMFLGERCPGKSIEEVNRLYGPVTVLSHHLND
jgi:hypothetical protein